MLSVETVRRSDAPAESPGAAIAAWRPPGAFDDYLLVRPLGRGAMGEVYLARDHVLDRPVALKFVGDLGSDGRERFLVEARAAARIQHPNVMAIFRVGEVDGHPYFVSEYVPGQSLAELALPIPWLHALELAVGLARGLAAAHRQGVLHRDIKPANALLDEHGVVKLLDFSLAKFVDSSRDGGPGAARPAGPVDREATAAGTLLGTPSYMAPELWRAEPATRRSDVYALGVLLHTLCLGRPPNDGMSSDELCVRVQYQDTAPLADGVPDIDPRFAAILDRCLRRCPDERYTSGEELRAALEALAPVAHAEAEQLGNPYRGLRAYAAEQRAVFFGRVAEIQAVVERLRGSSLVIVSGDPGVGKSSLCRAGVLPAIRDGALAAGRAWTTATIGPGGDPHRAIVAALDACLRRPPTSVAALLDDDPAEFVDEVRRALREDRGLVLLVDPLDELLTATGPAAAARLLACLVLAGPGVRVLATVRSDRLGRLARHPAFRGEPSPASHRLSAMTPGGAREAVVGPARTRGVRFESTELVDRLVAVAVAGSLPLLQLVLAELWAARDVGGALITAAALERIGGVPAVLARHADRVLSGLPPVQRRTARIMLMRLVTSADARASLSAEALMVGPESPATLAALLEAHLLVVREEVAGAVHEIAHEALVHGWLTLQCWLDGDREARVVRHRLEADAAEWQRLAHPNGSLWRTQQVAESRVDPATLHPRELAFLAASRARVGRRRTRRRGAALAANLVLLAVLGLLVVGGRACGLAPELLAADGHSSRRI
jgi:hypothetical protein